MEASSTEMIKSVQMPCPDTLRGALMKVVFRQGACGKEEPMSTLTVSVANRWGLLSHFFITTNHVPSASGEQIVQKIVSQSI